ncbi:F-box domain containing protein [Parasponia andersonii]|uniref:F-box domain containing protein n=1 Tax=Parasponia andersonii TaxID=3476 RepID=A0A2P5BCL0_PARAD|nr:F-box domain containing protein [Parasponia andersonii]
MDSNNREEQQKTSRSKEENDQSLPAASTGIVSLPREIMLQILSKVSISSLVQFKYVSKAWRILTQDPYLLDHLYPNRSREDNQLCLIFHSNYPIKNQLYFVDFDAIYSGKETPVKKIEMPFCSSSPEFDVVSSCNGLLCLSSDNSSITSVYNPFTREYRELPNTNQYPKQSVVLGFGFHPSAKEYKVVKIIYYWSNEQTNLRHGIRRFSFPKSEVQVLSLGSSSWRSLGKTSYYLDDWPGQVLLNGRIHWETRPRRYRPHRNIISFDLADEQFREIPKPDHLILRNLAYLAVLRGCLSIGLYVNYGKLEIWVMKEYGLNESWAKEFNIGSYVPKALELGLERSSMISRIAKRRSFNRVLYVLKNGKILLEYKCKALVLYDPKTEDFKDVGFKGMPNWCETVVHVGNLNQIDTTFGL